MNIVRTSPLNTTREEEDICSISPTLRNTIVRNGPANDDHFTGALKRRMLADAAGVRVGGRNN